MHARVEVFHCPQSPLDTSGSWQSADCPIPGFPDNTPGSPPASCHVIHYFHVSLSSCPAVVFQDLVLDLQLSSFDISSSHSLIEKRSFSWFQLQSPSLAPISNSVPALNSIWLQNISSRHASSINPTLAQHVISSSTVDYLLILFLVMVPLIF